MRLLLKVHKFKKVLQLLLLLSSEAPATSFKIVPLEEPYKVGEPFQVYWHAQIDLIKHKLELKNIILSILYFSIKRRILSVARSLKEKSYDFGTRGTFLQTTRILFHHMI